MGSSHDLVGTAQQMVEGQGARKIEPITFRVGQIILPVFAVSFCLSFNKIFFPSCGCSSILEAGRSLWLEVPSLPHCPHIAAS